MEKEKVVEKGTDLLLTDLRKRNTINFGNVSEYAFDEKGNWLTWNTYAYSKTDNGLQLRNMNSGEVLAH